MSAFFASLCVPGTFGGLSLHGAEILSVSASLVTNYTASVAAVFRITQPSTEVQNATFCNVTVTYTHPGQNDNIITEAWLPTEDWNGRFLAVGGGGFAAGRGFLSFENMKGAIGDGYATITTDSGFGDAQEPTPWALVSPGNVNLYNLQNLAHVSLNDEAIIGKALIKNLYGKGPEYSYWNGCSQGGRQGLALAQRYPKAYDGISAAAPAIYWSDFFTSSHWPQQFMNNLGTYPYGCEIDAITAAAVAVCDGLDGVVDGIIADPDACLARFDPFSLVGKVIDCNQTIDGSQVDISHAAAATVNATWHGASKPNGTPIWPGVLPGADLTGLSQTFPGQVSLAATNCTTGTCVGAPIFLTVKWLQMFLAKDPSFDVANLTHVEYDRLIHAGKQQFASFMDTADPDLSDFRDVGGKMITFHGLADNVIPPGGSEKYYQEVSALLPDTPSFYRYFEVPGLGHCFGGRAGQPSSLFEQLRAWVENGTAPGQTPIDVNAADGTVHHRILCPYPHVSVFDEGCGDAAAVACWSCGERGGSSRFLKRSDNQTGL
ncbi:Tannase/feruloyl esterase [Lasiosphaeria hispida]|uniref:Carboxylic ester hydrolase n=1 Tax=Lasiosphaeria hispida TaxID=260671 RepID=A0AAJ0HB48_9PEZI|nr:Tannase/feruloyl esterase [Lasiosphaeria hispida]